MSIGYAGWEWNGEDDDDPTNAGWEYIMAIIVAIYLWCGIAIFYYDALANLTLTIDGIHTRRFPCEEQRIHSRVLILFFI